MPRCANAARPQGSSFYSAELQPAQSRCGMNLEERGALFEATFGAAPGAACCSVQCSHAILLCFRSHSQTSFRVLAGCGPVDFSKWSKHFCMAIGPAESWLLIKAIRAECVPRATKFFATFGDIRHVKMRKLGPVRQIDVALEFSSGLDAVHRYLAERGITVHLRNTSVARAGPQPVQSERRRPPWPPPLPHHLQQQQQPKPQPPQPQPQPQQQQQAQQQRSQDDRSRISLEGLATVAAQIDSGCQHFEASRDGSGLLQQLAESGSVWSGSDNSGDSDTDGNSESGGGAAESAGSGSDRGLTANATSERNNSSGSDSDSGDCGGSGSDTGSNTKFSAGTRTGGQTAAGKRGGGSGSGSDSGDSGGSGSDAGSDTSNIGCGTRTGGQTAAGKRGRSPSSGSDSGDSGGSGSDAGSDTSNVGAGTRTTTHSRQYYPDEMGERPAKRAAIEAEQ